MNNKEIVSKNQIIWMLFLLITSFVVLEIPGMLIFNSGRDTWLSVIIAWSMDVLLAIVYAYMTLRFYGQNFVQYSITILGKYFGRIVGIMFPIFFMLVTALLLRVLSILLISFFLPGTSVEIILFFCCILIIYAVKKGIEVIARVCEILSPFFLSSLLILFFLALPSMKIERLEPQLSEGIYPIITGSLFILPFFGICIIMSMYGPICNHPENIFLAKYVAVSIGAFVVCLLVLLSIGVFGVKVSGNMLNPGLELARYIRMGEYFERVDVVWFMISMGAGIIAASCLIWAFCLGISQIIGISSYKPIVTPSVLLAYVVSIISFDSDIAVLNFTFYSFPFIGIFVETGLELFLFIMAILFKKRITKQK